MEPSKLALGRTDPSDESRAPRNRSKTLKGASKPLRPRARLQFIGFRRLENEGVAAPKECASRCYLATKEQGLKISSPFDFSFLRPAEAMHAKIHLKRVCDEMVAMILVVNPAIHLVARAPKQLLCRQRCGQEFGSWREVGWLDLQYE
jgi:hypothetical protein